MAAFAVPKTTTGDRGMTNTEYDRLRDHIQNGKQISPERALEMIENQLDEWQLEQIEPAIRLAPALRGGCCKSHTD